MSWYVDKGLAKLNAQLKERFPGLVIGTIAGGGHVATWPATDHAPEPDGSVDASDVMLGKAFTKENGEWLWNTLRQYRDRRIAYIIWNRHIVSSTVQPWVVRPYEGNDPHTGHVHISVNDKHENDASEWKLNGKKHTMESLDNLGLPVLKYGMSDSDYDGWDNIKRMQRQIGVTADGEYGPKTRDALKADGYGDGTRVGLSEWKSLYGLTWIG